MKKLLLILPLYFIANLQAECQSCNAPRARRTSRYTNKESYQEVRSARKSRRVVQPVVEAQPARISKAAPQEMDMIDVADVVAEQPKPKMQMIPTPQANVAKPMAPKPVAVANTEIMRAKIHEGANQINYTASLGKTGALVHVVETKPVHATLSGKMIMPQVVEGQMVQKERALSDDEARMYHQKIKAAAAA